MKQYEAYKDSDIEWIDKIPEHWQVKRLKLLGDIIPSNVDKKTKEGEQKVLLCNYVDVYKNDFITEDIQFMKASASDAQIEKLTLRKHDVIATKDSEDPKDIGVPALVKNNFNNVVCGYHLTLIRSNMNVLNGDYFYWVIRSEGSSQYFYTEARGITRYAIGSSVFKNLNIPIPESLEEQTQIAKYLNHKTTQLDTLIAKKGQLINLLQEERTAMINQAVTKGLDQNVPMKDSGIEWLGEVPEHWEVKKLKYLFKLGTGLNITKANLKDNGVYCVNYGEIHSKYGFELDTEVHQLKYVEKDYLITHQKALLNKGDFVFADTSEDVEGAGNFTHLISEQKVFAGYHTIVAKPYFDIISRYFAFQFDTLPLRNQIRQTIKGVKVFSITQSILKNIDLWLPPINEQKEISDFLTDESNKINCILKSTKEEIDFLKEYKTALISEVVTGKVDVREEVLN